MWRYWTFYWKKRIEVSQFFIKWEHDNEKDFDQFITEFETIIPYETVWELNSQLTMHALPKFNIFTSIRNLKSDNLRDLKSSWEIQRSFF